ncbi:hypothetical protein [Oryzicola mucosus]|uniref:Uncharacterized protein n=1 Tax=Oryzicola mucosus TaxID=2767425 RepID=A0A8J6PU20_9HYPH|nr:hypothetical protein [Oryzicola mucosus]MBD0415589.1 hypothetical protein [Oryzicola mucosus]
MDRTAGVEPPRDDPADPVSAAPAPPQGVGRDPHDRVDGESAERVVGSDAALPGDIVAAASIDHQAAKLEKAKGEQRGRKVRGQKAKTVAVALELASVVHNADDLRIDAEIKVLREQLASKLRLQNAQLKKMLERFER